LTTILKKDRIREEAELAQQTREDDRMECRNPYIENFLKKLIEKKGEKLEPDAQERLIESLNRLLENMLGRNMVAALPEEVRSHFVSQYDKGTQNVDIAQMSQTFDRYITNPAEIMKKTLKEFADLYFRNR
jgi:hypothetical protein